MKRIYYIFIFILLLPLNVSASSLGKQLSGKILLNVEGSGEAWYVNPADYKRYYLGRPADAFRIMRELAVGITNEKLASIKPSDKDLNMLSGANGGFISANANSTSSLSGLNKASATLPVADQGYDMDLSRQVAGKILLQVESNGEAWYVNPRDYKRYYLGRPGDAFKIMRELSLGITRENLARINKLGVSESINQYSSYEHKKIKTIDGDFTIDIVMIDLANPKLKIITDTADDQSCKKNCQAKSLASFVFRNNGFAGINGSYFCASSKCGSDPRNYYFFPVYNTRTGKLINEDQLKYWTTGPIIAFDVNNKFYYFKDSRELKSAADFEKTNGVKLQAAIGNKPRLIQDYMNYLIEWELDQKQLTGRNLKNAIGYKDNKIYLVAAYNTTILNLANVMKAIGVEYALNLDGGYSGAIIYNGEYMLGPGRDIPNAIIFAESK